MKRISILILFGVIAWGANGQSTTAPKKWKLTQINVGVIVNEDIVPINQLEKLASGLSNGQEDNTGRELNTENNWYRGTSGGGYNLNLSFSPYNYLKGERNLRHNVILGVTFMPFKELMVNYNSTLTDLEDNDITYCEYYSELNFSLGYRYSLPINKWMSLFAGVNGEVGNTFGNKLVTLGEGDISINTGTSTKRNIIGTMRGGVNAGIEINPTSRLGMFFKMGLGQGMMAFAGGVYRVNTKDFSFGLTYSLNDLFALKRKAKNVKKAHFIMSDKTSSDGLILK